MIVTKISLAVSSIALLALSACSSTGSSQWSRNCQKHFSVTSRELSQCKQKVANNDSTTIPAGTITIDPENASREDFDSVGRGGEPDHGVSAS